MGISTLLWQLNANWRENSDMSRKRLAIARLIQLTGANSLLARGKQPTLLVFNYHRLKSSTQGWSTPFDDGVFGPDVRIFREQMTWLRVATRILDEDGLMRLSEGGEAERGVIYSAVTFDDGYADCHALAKPVLDALGIKGFFFLPFNMINERQLGWWDIAAYLLKNSHRGQFTVDGLEYDIANGALKRILDYFKLQRAEYTTSLLKKLAEACEVDLPSREVQDRELMTWDQVRDLRIAGHVIGSHTLSHRVLATLASSEQSTEIKDSRAALQRELNCEIRSFAYPVGGPQHVNAESVRLVREAGYSLAFTFNTGKAMLPLGDRYQIPRESANSLEILKAKVSLPGVMGLREIRVA